MHYGITIAFSIGILHFCVNSLSLSLSIYIQHYTTYTVYCFSINAADLSPGVKLRRVEKDETSSSGALLSSMQHDAANAADVDARASR